jgi:hypothetical protein
VTDSGALATRLLDAVLNAGLGVSEFDELLSDEIASAASEDGLSASGLPRTEHTTLRPIKLLSSHKSARCCRIRFSWLTCMYACDIQFTQSNARRPSCALGSPQDAWEWLLRNIETAGGAIIPGEYHCAGGSLRDYQVQLEELRALLWGQALQFVGGGSPRRGGGGGGSSGNGDDSSAAVD